MSASHFSERSSRWITRPLCVRYTSASFRSVLVLVNEARGIADLTVHWGVGYLLDGEREVLGAWATREAVATLPGSLVDDLHLRGVVQIRNLTGRCVGSRAHDFSGEALALVRCRQVLPFEGHGLSESTGVRLLPARIADLVLAGDRLADEIQQRLLAALSRRRAFADQDAVMRFFASALYREDRRLWARPAPIKPLPVETCVAAPSVLH